MLTAELDPGRARVRDARPGCLTARRSTSSPPFRCSKAETRRTWRSWRACCGGGTVREGEMLWRQGDEARELLFVVEGARRGLAARARRPRRWRSARPARGEMLGEIALLDGGGTR